MKTIRQRDNALTHKVYVNAEGAIHKYTNSIKKIGEFDTYAEAQKYASEVYRRQPQTIELYGPYYHHLFNPCYDLI